MMRKEIAGAMITVSVHFANIVKVSMRHSLLNGFLFIAIQHTMKLEKEVINIRCQSDSATNALEIEL